MINEDKKPQKKKKVKGRITIGEKAVLTQNEDEKEKDYNQAKDETLKNKDKAEEPNDTYHRKLKELADDDEEESDTDEKRDLKVNNQGKVLNPFFKDPKLFVQPRPKKFTKFKMTFIELFAQMLPCCKSNKDLMNKKKIFTECGSSIYSYLDVERQVQILREYEELRNVVLSREEYKLLKYLTTPKIIMLKDEVTIAKIDKFKIDDDQVKQNYKKFVQNMNRLLNLPYCSLIEYNLLDLHKCMVSLEPTKLSQKDAKSKENKKAENHAK